MTSPAWPAAQEIEVALGAPEHGPRVLAPFGRRRCEVRTNQPVGSYRLVGCDDPAGPTPLAGQFYMLAAVKRWGAGESQRPYLARAFSVCRLRGHRLDFLVDDIGPGTRALAKLTPGEPIWIFGPLGIGFSPPAALSPDASARALLVAGGAGTAPLVIWREALVEAGIATRALGGFRSHDQCPAAQLLGDDVCVATEDGSLGFPGLATDLLEAELAESRSQVVYACGPPAMLEAVRRICSARLVPAQLAMEETMACGFGACYGCVVRTRSGFRRLCVDGPIVSVADLDERWLAG